VEEAVRREGVKLQAILNTHHHWDHVGGNKGLLKAHPALKVYGHRSDLGRIEGLNAGLEMGGGFRLGALEFRVLHNPGHTLGAITYVVNGCAFTGDTLFGAGCGRVFEGTMEMMYRSLNEVIGSLPAETNIYFGHEYTENNLRFAQTVEPGNAEAAARLEAARRERAAGRFTTPSTMALERRTNPFLRCGEPGPRAAAKRAGAGDSPAAVFGAIRGMKDRF
jgi:hydroxyacylglutathione hydrolase